MEKPQLNNNTTIVIVSVIIAILATNIPLYLWQQSVADVTNTALQDTIMTLQEQLTQQEAELLQMKEEQNDVPEKVVIERQPPIRIASTYQNTSYHYLFSLPEEVELRTHLEAAPPMDPAEVSRIALSFHGPKVHAKMSAMQSPDIFPEIRGSQDLSASAFIETWWMENKNEEPTRTPQVLSPIFEKTINGIDWVGFTVEGVISYMNNTGGEVLETPRTFFMTKHNETFYRWHVDTSYQVELESILETFMFTNVK